MAPMIFILFFLNFSFAETPLSSIRPYNEDYKNYLNQNTDPDLPSFETALSANQNIQNEPWKNMTESNISPEDLQKLFIDIRDQQPLRDQNGNLRRLTWLFPDDGCFARSALAQNFASHLPNTKLKQIFIFGNLDAKTPNHPSGHVTWWYHVAPIIKTSYGAFAIDPAIDPSRPIFVNDWIEKILPNRSDAKVSLCSPATFGPQSFCKTYSPIDTDQAIGIETNTYLRLEWQRVQGLGRDPQKELGPEPPWNFFLN